MVIQATMTIQVILKLLLRAGGALAPPLQTVPVEVHRQLSSSV